MDYSQYALENAVLTLLPQEQKNKPNDVTHLFPKITEKFFLLTEEPSPVDKACYKIVKAALSDINNHNLVTYGKKELAHEIMEQAKKEMMENTYLLSSHEGSQSNHPEIDIAESIPLNSQNERIFYPEYDEMEYN